MSRHRDDWTCDKCGDHQFARTTSCRECGARRPRRFVHAAGGGGGGVGSGTTAIEHKRGDWNCPRCGDHQFARNTSCRKCGAARPPEETGKKREEVETVVTKAATAVAEEADDAEVFQLPLPAARGGRMAPTVEEEEVTHHQQQQQMPKKSAGWVYTLRLHDDYFYVGHTTRPVNQRLDEHLTSVGAAWTKLHPVKSLEDVVEGDGWQEFQTTINLMREHGVDRVRGGPFCTVELNAQDRAHIQTTLDATANTCFECHRPGHMARECPQRLTRGLKRPRPVEEGNTDKEEKKKDVELDLILEAWARELVEPKNKKQKKKESGGGDDDDKFDFEEEVKKAKAEREAAIKGKEAPEDAFCVIS